jgi:putative endopeptidase
MSALPAEEATKFPKLHHPHDRASLDTLAPNTDWERLFTAYGVPGLTALNVAIPGELRTVDSLLGRAPLDAWRSYLRWRVASFAAPYLSPRFEQEYLALRKITRGESALRPRWQRCLQATDEQIGQVLGKAYVRVAFTPAAKARMLDLIDNLRAALRSRMERLDWMSQETKQAALAKLDAMTSKIGYPDKWRDYSRLSVRPGSFLANVLAAQRFEEDRQNARVNRLVHLV